MQYYTLIILFGTFFGGSFAGYSASDSENELGQGNAGATSYGYGGSYSGVGFPNGNVPIPFFPQWDFSGYLSKYFESLSRQHQAFVQQLQQQAQAALAQAQSQGQTPQSTYYVPPQGQTPQSTYYVPPQGHTPQSTYYVPPQGHQELPNLANRVGLVGGFGGGFAGPDGTGFSFAGPIGGGAETGTGLDGSAVASGSIGPSGVQQTAAVFPENPNVPNINTRFGPEGGNGGGFKSVFTSSKSVTTNVDGKPQTFREASTTVNDNGKVTTFTAKNP